MTAEPNATSVDLADYLGVIRRRKALVAAIIIGCTILGVAYGMTRPERWTARSEVQIPDSEVTEGAPRLAASDVLTEARVMESEVVAEQAVEQLDFDVSPRVLLSRVAVTAPSEARILQVEFTDETPRRAQAGAQAFAEAYVEINRANVVDRLEQRATAQQQVVSDTEDQLRDAEAALAQINPDEEPAQWAAANRRVDTLSAQLGDARLELRDIEQTEVAPGLVLTPANLPGSPSTPGPVRTGALGLLGGGILALGVAFVADRLDAQVRDKGSIEHHLGVTTLGTVPTFGDGYRTAETSLVTLQDPDSSEADAFRRLRASFLIAVADADTQVVCFTSANRGEGKSTVSANLATVLAQGGHSVALVSADIRRPSLGRIFGLQAGEGLTNVLHGNLRLDEALHDIGGGLSVLMAGSTEEAKWRNPSDLLQSDPMSDVLRQLRKRFDFVLLDAPPVLAVADTHGLATLADAMVLVVSIADTSEADVVETEQQLARVGSKFLGVVVNRGPSQSKRYHSYREVSSGR
jgi:capsular exopolysaccharide synthesis family protein